MTDAEAAADPRAMLAAVRASVASARAVPMSASCVVNRAETLASIDAIIKALPERLAAAEAVLAQSQAVLAAAGEQAEALLADASREAERRLADSEQGTAAAAWASVLRQEAEAEAAGSRAETDEFVDRKLAHLEAVLEKTLSQTRHEPGPEPVTVSEIESRLAELAEQIEQMLVGVRRGRERVHGRLHMEDLGEHLRSLDDAGGEAVGEGLGTREELG